MATVISRLRGTAAILSTQTLQAGVIAVDTTNNSLRVFDGVTVGGHEIVNKTKTSDSLTGVPATLRDWDKAGLMYHSGPGGEYKQVVLESGAGLELVEAALGGQPVLVLRVDSTVPDTATTFSAGDGLTGGGSLAADRILAVDSSVVRTTRNVLTLPAGGLVGGGNMATDLSLGVNIATQATVLTPDLAAPSIITDSLLKRYTEYKTDLLTFSQLSTSLIPLNGYNPSNPDDDYDFVISFMGLEADAAAATTVNFSFTNAAGTQISLAGNVHSQFSLTNAAAVSTAQNVSGSVLAISLSAAYALHGELKGKMFWDSPFSPNRPRIEFVGNLMRTNGTTYQHINVVGTHGGFPLDKLGYSANDAIKLRIRKSTPAGTGAFSSGGVIVKRRKIMMS